MKKKINFFFEKIKFILKLRLYVIFYKFLDFGAPQEGENIILNRIFAKKKKGFYVDIGAHHPIRFSNTLSLYKRGWSGINIEPNAKLINYFKKYRPEDKNLNYAISMRKGTKNYYSFQDPALNTLDEKIKNLRMKQGFKIISKTKVNVDTMVNVLNKYCNYKKKLIS